MQILQSDWPSYLYYYQPLKYSWPPVFFEMRCFNNSSEVLEYILDVNG